MSYEVLARKWRPQTFDEVVGQDHITRTLRKAVESGRISHAYLLSGPRGCGKTSTARIIAKVINCTNLQGGNPCNECDSCVGILKGRNLDMVEIDGASHTGVNEVRNLQESIGYAPSQFQNKIYIIDEVHMLSTHAFNALLKTLEEPPAHVYFVFATTAANKIPDTIKSRCQRHQFKRLEVTEIAAQLEVICKAEKVEYEEEALRLLARKAEGSMRDGESLLDQVITASSGKVKTGSVRSVLGLLDHDMIGGFLEAMAGGDATAVLKRLDSAVGQGVDLEELLNALIEGFRDVMLLATSGDLKDLIVRSKDEVAHLESLTDKYELGDLVTIVERLCNSAPRLKMASDPRILMESVLVDLTMLDRQTDIRELLDKLGGAGAPEDRPAPRPRKPAPRKRDVRSSTARKMDASDDETFRSPPQPPVENTGQTPPAESPATVAADVTGAKQVDLSSLDYAEARKVWEGFVTWVRQKKVALGVCLISGTLKSIDAKAVMLGFARGFTFQKDQVDNPKNRGFLKKMMSRYFGRELELVCFTEGEEAKADREKLEATRSEDADAVTQRAVADMPLVKKILTDFDGEIIRYHP
jgi:DNA polymerase-3 subunit gamma/tau